MCDRPYHYTAAEREEILAKLLAIAQDDRRTAGILLVGSGSVGFDDEYSDIDLQVVIDSGQDVRPAFLDFGAAVNEALPVFRFVESVRGPNVYLWALLLDNFLEIDVCFLCLTDLTARRARWSIVFDRTGGRIEAIQRRTWAEREPPDLEATYRARLGSIWHYIIHATVAVLRGQRWRAVWEIEEIRNRTIELRGLRTGLETKRYRQVDQMSRDFLEGLARTIPSSLAKGDLVSAVKATVDGFFREAGQLDELLGLDLAPGLESKMRQYLEVI